MPGTPTTNLGLTVPTVLGDSGIWGSELNTDLGIIDGLGIGPIVVQSSNFTATPSINPETYWRVTTGSGGVTATLPAASATAGKYLTFKKIDSGVGALTISGSIDGQTSYVVPAQFQGVRLFSNGSTYDVVGTF